ncbi:MAG: HEPN domain-containing protein [Thermosynechococcaceae cyanobacterium]
MSDPVKLSQRWISSAIADFKSIQKLVSEPPILSTAIFHCQQCAEKSMKALLILNGVSSEMQRFKTHNLRFLLRETTSFYPEMSQFDKSIEALNDMDTFYRYPQDEEPSEPTVTEFKNAFSTAQSILKKATQILEAKIKAQQDKQQTPEQIWESLSKSFSSTGVKLSQQVALKAFQNKHSEETVAQILAHDPQAIDLKQNEGSDRANQYIKTIINGAKFTLRQSPRPQQDIDLEP